MEREYWYCTERMLSSPPINLMHGRLPTYDDLFAEENFVESLDFDFILSAVNSIPLYKRLKINPDLFSESERENIDTDASNSFKSFKEKLSGKRNATVYNACKVLLDPCETEYNLTDKRREKNLRSKEETSPDNEKIEEDSDETFLKYVYDPKGNNLLVPTLQKNVNFTIFPTSEKRDLKTQGPNFEELHKLLNDIGVGKYDHLARCRTSPSFSSSSSESEEDVSYRSKNLSSRLQFSPGDSTKFSFLKNISEDSLKINTRETMEKEKANFHANWLTSDDDSDQAGCRKNQTETKRRSKRSQKTETESKRVTKETSAQKSQVVKNKPHARRKLKFGNVQKAQDCSSQTTDDFSASGGKTSNTKNASTEYALQPIDYKSEVSVQECSETKVQVSVLQQSLSQISISQQSESQAKVSAPHHTSHGNISVQGKKYQKSMINIGNKCLNSGKFSMEKPDELSVMPGEELSVGKKTAFKERSEPLGASSFGREKTVKNAVPTMSLESLDGSSSSRGIETKDQKQMSNEMKSSISASNQCKPSNIAHSYTNDSSDSTDEDWENLAQRNLSVVDKLLQTSKH